MKKIIILLFFIFYLTGCSDYKELDNLAIISGIAVDYNTQEEKFELAFEILNEESSSQNSKDNEKTYYVFGSGKSITDAFNNTNLEINKIPYYSHIKTMIMSEEIAQYHAKEITDYIVRNSFINNTFFIAIAKDVDAKDIIQKTSTGNKILSESIYKLIDNTDLGNSLSAKIDLQDFTSLLVNPMQDIYLPTITLENDELKLQGIAIFENTKIKDILNFNESQTLNILFNKSKNAYYQFKCDDKSNKYMVIDIYKQKIGFKINKNEYQINADLMAKIEENQCNYNLKDKNTYKKLQNKFNKIFTNDLNNLLEILKVNNSDVLGINYKYYKDNNKTIDFKNLNYSVKTNININKNGLIFEVKNDNK